MKGFHMVKFNPPPPEQLPSLKQLNRAALFAVSIAIVLFVTTFLPAEEGFDPTGVGTVLGLTPMGQMKHGKVAGHSEAQTAQKPSVVAPSVPPLAQPGIGDVSLTLQPNEGREVKATMKAGAEFRYRWKTDGPEVRYELHGEPASAEGDEYTSYEKGTSAGASGKFRAPFDGTHGWYWQNRSGKPVTITVNANGDFQKFAAIP